ncbi:MAG: cytochrome P450 [Chloroflexota bacterium]
MATAVLEQQPQTLENKVPFFANYLDYRADPLQFWIDVGQAGPLVEIQLGPAQKFWVVTDADLFRQILLTKSKNFPRDRQIREGNAIDNGRTVFNAKTYKEWRWRRRLLQPGFHKRELNKFAETIVTETAQMADELPQNEPINLADMTKKLTMRIICQTMFSASLEDTDVLQRAFEQTSYFGFRRMSSIMNVPTWLPTKLNLETKAAVKDKYRILGNIVDERLASSKPNDDVPTSWDMLDMLIAAELDDEDDMPGAERSFGRDDLIAEMSSLVFAGHETTAMTLLWLLNVVATNPLIRQKLQAEIDTVLGDRSATLEDLDKMPYTHQVIQETLRYYPSVYVTLREAKEDDELTADGVTYPVPAGRQFIMNIRALHHSEKYWSHADEFDPERFSAENSHRRHKHAYQPFISGPKKCIGDQFAMMEMRLVVPTLLQRLTFEPVSTHPAHQVKEAAGFVMETEEAVMMKVTRKKK